MTIDVGPVLGALAARQAELARHLTEVEPDRLLGPSLLPRWSRLTIVCHLRYGAEASRRLTDELLRGEPAAFYPGGRSLVRDATLVLRPGEGPAEAVASLLQASSELETRWSGLGPDDWSRTLAEPADNIDLGPIPLARLALLRLTEVEVHGTDLDLGLGEWSPRFVSAALADRLAWLTTRRSNHSPVDTDVTGTWWLDASDGPTWRVEAGPTGVDVSRSGLDDRVGTRGPADAVIRGTGAQLLALLLGRGGPSGSVAAVASFGRAFPPP